MEGTKKRGLSPAQKKKVREIFLPFFFFSVHPPFLSFFSKKLIKIPTENAVNHKLAKAKEAILANDR